MIILFSISLSIFHYLNLMKNSNDIIIQRIMESIPSHIKLPEFLMDKLGLCRESAYRRIRGDIPLTVDQIMDLSLELGFSIDELTTARKDNYLIYKQRTIDSYDPQKTFIAMLEPAYYNLVKQYKTKDLCIIIAANRLFDIISIGYENLFRFYYYKWTHQIKDTSIDHSFSETVLPSEIVELRDKILPYLGKINNVTIIIDPGTFYNTLLDIQYYYSRKLINEKEIGLLKNELKGFLEQTEIGIKKGGWNPDKNYYYYLSAIAIEANSCYVCYKNETESHFWPNSVTPLSSYNKQATDLHKLWLESLKKYAVLITQSNESVHASYLKKQYELLETMF